MVVEICAGHEPVSILIRVGLVVNGEPDEALWILPSRSEREASITICVGNGLCAAQAPARTLERDDVGLGGHDGCLSGVHLALQRNDV